MTTNKTKSQNVGWAKQSVPIKHFKKGKILRVKKGYNPNSSSIGSIVFAVPTMLLVSATLFGTASAIIFSKFINNPDETTTEETKDDNEDADETSI